MGTGEDIWDMFDHKETKWESVKYWPYRQWSKLKQGMYEIKYSFQRLFKGHSDSDVFEFYFNISRLILPRLIDYKKHLHGYPAIFSEYEEPGPWENKEKYDEAIKNGSMLGGGSEAWEAILDKMIFAFTQVIVEDGYARTKLEKRLTKEHIEKYGDVWEKKEENAHKSEYHLFTNPDAKGMEAAVSHVPDELFDDKTVEDYKKEGLIYRGFKKRRPFYHNDKLAEELRTKQDEGLALFAKYFKNLWD